MNDINRDLEKLCEQHPKFLKKGGLCVALVVSRHAQMHDFPIDFKSLRTQEGGQVIGLGKVALQKILKTHGINDVLAQEGGRTNRGSLGLMKRYVNLLNTLHKHGKLDFPLIESWWIEKVRLQLGYCVSTASSFPKLKFDAGKSLAANIENLLAHARKLQSKSNGTNFVRAMLLHLVGAKLDLIFGIGKVIHHSSDIAYHSARGKGDFQIDSMAVHVTTNPNESLVRNCGDNLNHGLKPIIITTADAVGVAAFRLRNCGLNEWVDVLDCTQFLTANLYQRSLFLVADIKINFIKLLERYNQIVGEYEATPVLKVNLA